jgi:hypothetical protein
MFALTLSSAGKTFSFALISAPPSTKPSQQKKSYNQELSLPYRDQTNFPFPNFLAARSPVNIRNYRFKASRVFFRPTMFQRSFDVTVIFTLS